MIPKKSKTYTIVTWCVVVSSIIGAALFFLAYNNYLKIPKVFQTYVDIMPDLSAQDGNLAGLGDANQNNYRISVNRLATIELGDKKMNIGFENPKENYYSARLGVYGDSDGKLIANTYMVEPGQRVDEVIIKQPLEKGEHNATARFDIFYDKKPVETIKIDIVIRVI